MTGLGNRLRELRKAAGLSQRDLAEQVGVGFPHISKIENGTETPSAELLVRIAEAVGTSPDELLVLAERIPEDLARFVVEKSDLAPRFLRKWAEGGLTDKDVRRLLGEGNE